MRSNSNNPNPTFLRLSKKQAFGQTVLARGLLLHCSTGYKQASPSRNVNDALHRPPPLSPVAHKVPTLTFKGLSMVFELHTQLAFPSTLLRRTSKNYIEQKALGASKAYGALNPTRK